MGAPQRSLSVVSTLLALYFAGVLIHAAFSGAGDDWLTKGAALYAHAWLGGAIYRSFKRLQRAIYGARASVVVSPVVKIIAHPITVMAGLLAMLIAGFTLVLVEVFVFHLPYGKVWGIACICAVGCGFVSAALSRALSRALNHAKNAGRSDILSAALSEMLSDARSGILSAVHKAAQTRAQSDR